jgi:hypothetical protein
MLSKMVFVKLALHSAISVYLWKKFSMKRKLFPLTISLVTLCLVTLTACKEEPNILYPVLDPFDKLVVAQNVNVLLRNGTQDPIVTGSGDLSSIKLVVSDEILTIALPDPGMAQNVVVEIFHSNLQSVSCTQNGLVNFASDFTTSSHTLKLSAFNSGIIYSYLSLSVDTLDISLSDDSFVGFRQVDVHKNKLSVWGEAHCYLEGTAEDQLIEMTGPCDYNLYEEESGWAFSVPLQAENIWIDVRNDANAWVHASTYLNALGTTGSMVYYKGDPATIEENMTNGAELIQKNN